MRSKPFEEPCVFRLIALACILQSPLGLAADDPLPWPTGQPTTPATSTPSGVPGPVSYWPMLLGAQYTYVRQHQTSLLDAHARAKQALIDKVRELTCVTVGPEVATSGFARRMTALHDLGLVGPGADVSVNRT